MFNIAIDGPAGAGKSVVARLLSKELEFIYVDTGAMYRAIAFYVLENKINENNENLIESILDKVEVNIKYENKLQKVILNNKDISQYIRTEEIGGIASKISTYKSVRDKLLNLQRDIAKNNNVIMDGRDIGSFVLPKANLKIYLDAKVETRALRRYKELSQKGLSVDLKSLEEEIKIRDYRDKNRDIAPLKKVEDAFYIDSSDMSIEEVLQKIKSLMGKYEEGNKG